MRGGIYDKENGREYQWPSQIMDHKNYDSETLSRAFGELLNILLDRNLINRQDVMDVVPNSEYWLTLQAVERAED